MIYKRLKISEPSSLRYEVELDGVKVKGVKHAKVDFSLDELPVLTVSVYVESVEIVTDN